MMFHPALPFGGHPKIAYDDDIIDHGPMPSLILATSRWVDILIPFYK